MSIFLHMEIREQVSHRSRCKLHISFSNGQNWKFSDAEIIQATPALKSPEKRDVINCLSRQQKSRDAAGSDYLLVPPSSPDIVRATLSTSCIFLSLSLLVRVEPRRQKVP